MAKSYYNIVETVVSIFAEDQGTIKILLKRKEQEPYRNYWILPSNVLPNDQTLDELAKETAFNATGINIHYLYETKSFSRLDRDPVDRIIAVNYTSITIKNLAKTGDMQWFDIHELPKMAYDHEEIIQSNIAELKKRIIHNEDNILLKLFPQDFTLTELQSFFEYVLGKELDRRNFRKKLFNANMVVETGEKVKTAGRPGRLFVFNKGGYFNE